MPESRNDIVLPIVLEVTVTFQQRWRCNCRSGDSRGLRGLYLSSFASKSGGLRARERLGAIFDRILLFIIIILYIIIYIYFHIVSDLHNS